jgi:hypothetical protein
VVLRAVDLGGGGKRRGERKRYQPMALGSHRAICG